MKNITVEQTQPRTITIAELCEALASGAVQAQVEDDMYVIRGRDLMRLSRARTIQLPVLASARNALMQAS